MGQINQAGWGTNGRNGSYDLEGLRQSPAWKSLEKMGKPLPSDEATAITPCHHRLITLLCNLEQQC